MHGHRQSILASIGAAVGVSIAFLILWVWESNHRPDSLAAADNDRVGVWALSVAFAAVMSGMSLIFALRPILEGNLRPLIWLLIVFAGWVVFVAYFLLPFFAEMAGP